MVKRYTHRMVGVFFIAMAAYSGIIINLYRIQILHGTFYQTLGQQQYEITVTAYLPRAPLLDRNGQPLAINRQSLSAFITPNKLSNPEELKKFLRSYYPHILSRLESHKESSCLFIQRNLSDEQYQALVAHAIKDIHFAHEPNRYYPVPAAASLVGITDIDNKGIMGLELLYNNQLAGTPIVQHLWQDARSGHFYFNNEETSCGSQGTPVITSIDSTLQFLANEELLATMHEFKAKEGAVLVVNPDSGEVLAMVSQPSFDPNNRQDLNLEFTKNRTLTELYELGSVIKVFAGLAALEEGVVQADERIDCESKKTTYVNGRKVNTANYTEAGVITFSRVIERSNNIGIAKVALRLGDKLFDHYQRIGFTGLTGIQFPGSREGFVNPPDSWSKQSVLSLSYGYEIAITLAHLARAFCIIARDGYAVDLTLLRNDTAAARDTYKRLYSAESIGTIRQILENTTLHGSTHRARIKGYTIMSKSGTANTLVDGQYTTEKGIFTCAGIIQRGSYQRVVVVFIKDADAQGKELFASVVAAPLFERIAQKILIHDKVL